MSIDCQWSLQDNNLVECYWQENRVAIMVPAPPTPQASVSLFSNVSTELTLAAADNNNNDDNEEEEGDEEEGGVAEAEAESVGVGVAAVQAWAVDDIWISTQELLATPRPDAAAADADDHDDDDDDDDDDVSSTITTAQAQEE
jgi:hypothetical protein